MTLEALAQHIVATLGSRFETFSELPAGRTRRALRIDTGDGPLFVKLLPADRAAVFAAEADGLTLLTQTDTFRVPAIRSQASNDTYAWLALEWLDLQPVRDADDGRRFGEALAALHAVHGPHYGLHRDNWLGDSRQENGSSESWPLFFGRKRLLPQLATAVEGGLRGSLVSNIQGIVERIAALFLDYRPAASLLHGDLWHGNAGVDANGRPTVFDPAVHYGDREADFALAEMFGGFPTTMYATYLQSAPLHPNASSRRALYRLYHLLNHYNLHGTSYLRETERTAARLLSELT
ncbi:MAG: fructosamine kinase family protein [Pseudomonadota bacterium]